MSDQQATGPHDESQAAEPYPTAGAQLRAARESQGLSIDTVAQHLKLAPRQVRAIEDADFSQLPGRTFIRGFARNYARLMQLDPEAIVAALPGVEAAPALDRPAIGSSTRAMGELPDSQQPRRATWSKWAIPFAIAALIGVAAVYEVTRKDAPAPADRAPAARPAPIDPIGPSTSFATPLPNPLATGDAQPPATTPRDGIATGDPAAIPAPVSTLAPSPSLPISTAAAPSAASGAPRGDATLVISYRGSVWTEVRDGSGQRLLLVTGAPGTSETLNGTPPLELTLGNAAQASITWRGAALDLSAHVKGNVARVRLD